MPDGWLYGRDGTPPSSIALFLRSVSAGWNPLLPVHWLFPEFLSLHPAITGVFPGIEPGDIGFDIDQRRIIQDIDPAHLQDILQPFLQFHDGHPDPVWPAGVPGCKDAMRLIIQEGWSGQFYFPGPVENIEEDDVGEGFDRFQGFFIFRKYRHPPDPIRRRDSLDGTFFLRFIG